MIPTGHFIYKEAANVLFKYRQCISAISGYCQQLYNDENSLSCVITLCYLYARKDYDIKREAKSGKVYCDYLFLPKKNGKPAIILELKANDICKESLGRIKKKNYIKEAQIYASTIIMVGISYDKKSKTLMYD